MDTLNNTPSVEPKEKTPVEKLKETIDGLNQYQQNLSFFDILQIHMYRYPGDFHASEMARIIRGMELELLIKINRLMGIAEVAEERATWLKAYLEGRMFTSEEAAREHLPMQVKNAEAILDKCKER